MLAVCKGSNYCCERRWNSLWVLAVEMGSRTRWWWRIGGMNAAYLESLLHCSIGPIQHENGVSLLEPALCKCPHDIQGYHGSSCSYILQDNNFFNRSMNEASNLCSCYQQAFLQGTKVHFIRLFQPTLGPGSLNLQHRAWTTAIASIVQASHPRKMMREFPWDEMSSCSFRKKTSLIINSISLLRESRFSLVSIIISCLLL